MLLRTWHVLIHTEQLISDFDIASTPPAEIGLENKHRRIGAVALIDHQRDVVSTRDRSKHTSERLLLDPQLAVELLAFPSRQPVRAERDGDQLAERIELGRVDRLATTILNSLPIDDACVARIGDKARDELVAALGVLQPASTDKLVEHLSARQLLIVLAEDRFELIDTRFGLIAEPDVSELLDGHSVNPNSRKR